MSVVITKKTVSLVVGVGALAAWLAAAATSGVRPAGPVAPSRSQQIDLRGAALNAEIERLHDRLRPTAVPEHNRNLFQFVRSRSAAAPVAPAAEAAVPAPVAPVEPAFKLIGIAEDNSVRTAILSSPSQLQMVKQGDNVIAGATTYRVTGISADAIELTPTNDGVVLRLALK